MVDKAGEGPERLEGITVVVEKKPSSNRERKRLSVVSMGRAREVGITEEI